MTIFLNVLLLYLISLLGDDHDSSDERKPELVIEDNSKDILKLGNAFNFFQHNLGMVFDNEDKYVDFVKSQGKVYGVSYIKSFSKTSKQLLLRCSYYKKCSENGNQYYWPAMVNAWYLDKNHIQVHITGLCSTHYHNLQTFQEIKQKEQDSRKTIPQHLKEIAIKLFLSGERAKTIYENIKLNHYKGDCPFNFDPLNRYLYERNYKEMAKYASIDELFEAFSKENGFCNKLVIEKLGPDGALKALAFSFEEQINLSKYILVNS